MEADKHSRQEMKGKTVEEKPFEIDSDKDREYVYKEVIFYK